MHEHFDAESVLREFDRLWHSGQEPSIDDLLQRFPQAKSDLLVELVFADFEYRLARDPETRIEHYFDRYPELQRDRAISLDLIKHEFRLRQQQHPVTLEEYEIRFPDLAKALSERLGGQLDVRQEYSGLAARVAELLVGLSDDQASRELSPDDMLDRYKIVEKAGRGGFGVVYKAYDTQLDRFVAIKTSRATTSGCAQTAGRLLREARHVAKLKHPSIVPVLDVGTYDGSIYLVSDFIDGQTLAQKIESRRTADLNTAQMLAEVARGLHFAHQQGIIHRDVKPSNIILDVEDRPYITDFGLSRSDDDGSLLTLDGVMLGTPAYLSPEQAMGNGNRVDARTDVFSLGVVMYQLLTGQLPFQGDRQSMIQRVIHIEPKPVRNFKPDVSWDLETVCMKALAKDPAHRFQSALEMAEELDRIARGEPIRSRRANPLTRLSRWCRQKPVMACVLGGLILLVIGATTVAVVSSRRTRAYQSSAERHQRANLEAGVLARQAVDEMFRTLESEMGNSVEAESIRNRLARDAEKHFRQVVELRPNDPTAQAMLADAVYRVGVMNFRMGLPHGRSQTTGSGPRAVAADLRQRANSDRDSISAC